jgi:hypothetical protein
MDDTDLLNRTGDVAEPRATAVAKTGVDPFASYGAKVGKTGQYLSFNRAGEFVFGQSQEELKAGARLVANMPGLRIGWRRWFANQVTDDLTEPLVESPQIAPRNTLGDMDQALWEKDNEGKPRDPWQLTNILDLSDGEQTYIYSTGSKGGINAIGRLCAAYGKERRMRPGMLPIITLGRDSYNHPIFKKMYVPEFKIVGWTDEENPSLDGVVEPDEPPAPTAPDNGKRATRF